MSSLQHALLHFPGIGPVRLKRLMDAGISCWSDFQAIPPETLLHCGLDWHVLVSYAHQNLSELEHGNTAFFIDNLNTKDRWRLLHEHWQHLVFLDIETAGLERNDDITVISCWDGQKIKLFVKDENLDQFPDFLLTLPFLVTFNGASFDLPVIKHYFNLPDIPVPHVDLRWVCYNCSLTGGLKAIEHNLGLIRPDDLVGTDGAEAIELWQNWQCTHEEPFRSKLLRYCAADTIALRHVTALVLRKLSGLPEQFKFSPAQDWEALDAVLPKTALPTCHKPPSPAHTPNPPPAQPSAEATAASSPQLMARLQRFLNSKRS